MNQIDTLTDILVNKPCKRHPQYQTLFVCVAKHACRLQNVACSECIDSLKKGEIHELVSTKTFSKMKRAYALSVFEQQRKMTEIAKKWRIQVNREIEGIENLIMDRFRNRTQIQYFDFSSLASNAIWSEMKRTNKTDEDFQKTAKLHHTKIVNQGISLLQEINQKLQETKGKIKKKGKIKNPKLDNNCLVKFEAHEKQEERNEHSEEEPMIQAQNPQLQIVNPEKELQNLLEIDEALEEVENSTNKKNGQKEGEKQQKQNSLPKKRKPIKKATKKSLKEERSVINRKIKNKSSKKKKKRSDRLIRNVILKMGKGKFYDEQLADEYKISMPTLRKWEHMFFGESEARYRCKAMDCIGVHRQT